MRAIIQSFFLFFSSCLVSYREVEMAHKVLAKDMTELASTMRLAQQYRETTLDVEYRK